MAEDAHKTQKSICKVQTQKHWTKREYIPLRHSCKHIVGILDLLSHIFRALKKCNAFFNWAKSVAIAEHATMSFTAQYLKF